jgi:NAD(P)-dependent dehydrogenase (short-subunit alcohol dehydrogenase family)
LAIHAAVAVVVGAASGIGRRAAQRWAENGGLAVVADINEVGLEQTCNGHTRFHRHYLDVRDADAVAEFMQRTERDCGPIERVYNSAAIQPTQLLLDQEIAEIHRIMDTNYKGLVHVSLASLPPMLKRGRGALINFGSIAGWVPNIYFGAYNAAKAAGVMFTEVLHHENRGRGVDILCVCPAQVDTPLRLQARNHPKIMQKGPPPMKPDYVLDVIEKNLGRDRLFVFPGGTSVIGWYLRRFAPWMMWRIDHSAEGR